MSVVSRRFQIMRISDGIFLQKAQALRQRVFFGSQGYDTDQYDSFCTHLVVVDKTTGSVVGTYRMLLRSEAEKGCGFYSESEFDLRRIRDYYQGEILEIGRACVDPLYRKYPVLNRIWKEIFLFCSEHKVQVIIGCASILEPKPDSLGRINAFFRAHCFSSEALRVYPHPGKAYPYDRSVSLQPADHIAKTLPSLIKGYLNLGAVVCGDPVWDGVFQTADFFMMLDLTKSQTAYHRKFL